MVGPLYSKNSESDFFFLHQNQNIFFSNIGNQNIFLEKNHNPPFRLNGRSLTKWLETPDSSPLHNTAPSQIRIAFFQLFWIYGTN